MRDIRTYQDLEISKLCLKEEKEFIIRDYRLVENEKLEIFTLHIKIQKSVHKKKKSPFEIID